MTQAMRILFVLLVLANVALFAAGQGVFGPAPADRGRDPGRLLTERHPDTIHIPRNPERHAESPGTPIAATTAAAAAVPEPEARAPASSETSTTQTSPATSPLPTPSVTGSAAAQEAVSPASAPAPVPAPTPVPAPATAESPRPSETVCREWGSFSEADAKRARQWAQKNWPKLSVQSATEAGPVSWMVLVPSAGSLAAAKKTAATLSKQGIKDLFVIQDAGPHQYAISLGVFSQEKSARSLAQSLQNKAGRNLQVVARPGPSRHWLTFPAIDAGQQTALRQQALKQFKSEWRACKR